jgi:prevent-host-death family protein
MTKAPTVRIVTATEAKNKFGAMIKSAYALDEHLIVEKSGIPVVAIIPMADYRQLALAQGSTQNNDEIEAAQRRATARRELSEFIKERRAKMPHVDEDEEEAERLILREVSAVRAKRAKEMKRQKLQTKQSRARRVKAKEKQM